MQKTSSILSNILQTYYLIFILQYSGYFYGIILAPGLVYGQGEHILKYIYKMVFSDAEQLLVPKEDNNLPIIHVENLAKLNISFKIILIIFNKINTF